MSDLKRAIQEFLTSDSSLGDSEREKARDTVRSLIGARVYREERRPRSTQNGLALGMSASSGQVINGLARAVNTLVPIITFTIWSDDKSNENGEPDELFGAIRKLFHQYRGELNKAITVQAIHLESEPFDRSTRPVKGNDNWSHRKVFSFQFAYNT